MGNLFCCVQVDQSTVAIKETFGKFDEVLEPGCHCLPWFLGRSLAGHLTLRLQQLDVRCETKTKMVERRSEVVGRLKSLEERAALLIAFLQNPNAYPEHCFRCCNNSPLDEISLSSQNSPLKRSSLRRPPRFSKNSPSTLSD